MLYKVKSGAPSRGLIKIVDNNPGRAKGVSKKESSGLIRVVEIDGDADNGDNIKTLSREAGRKKTLEHLHHCLLRMYSNGQKDFPVLLHTLNLVKIHTSINDKSIDRFTDTISFDFDLTRKILEVVNSPFNSKLSRFGEINTLHRAISVLGIIQVRNIALSLTIFEHLHNPCIGDDVKEVFFMSLTSGILSSEIAERQGLSELLDQAFICSLLFDFGKLLIKYYMPEESRKINELVSNEKTDEREMAEKMLGITYEEAGEIMAKYCKFPEEIVYSMGRIVSYERDIPENRPDRLRYLSNFTNKLCQLISHSDKNSVGIKADLCHLLGEQAQFKFSGKEVNEIFVSVIKKISKYTEEFNFDASGIPFFNKLASFGQTL